MQRYIAAQKLANQEHAIKESNAFQKTRWRVIGTLCTIFYLTRDKVAPHVPDECDIHMLPLEDPVYIGSKYCGQLYERSALLEWLSKSKNIDPRTREPVDQNKDIHPVQEWQLFCYATDALKVAPKIMVWAHGQRVDSVAFSRVWDQKLKRIEIYKDGQHEEEIIPFSGAVLVTSRSLLDASDWVYLHHMVNTRLPKSPVLRLSSSGTRELEYKVLNLSSMIGKALHENAFVLRATVCFIFRFD